MRKSIRFSACIFICATLLTSCSSKEYRKDIGCLELCDLAIESFSDKKGYSEYSANFIEYEFGENAQNADDSAILYSEKVEDINEIGIFFADDEDDVRDIAKDCRKYLEDMKENKRAFISSYAPTELPKLDSAGVKICGNYVIYCILDKDTADIVYDEIEKRLSNSDA